MSKDRRQVEIIALLLNSKEPLSVADLCQHYKVEVATIHRDLRELRERGVQVHSVSGVLQILTALSDKDLHQLLSVYLSSVGNVISFPKSISLVVKKLRQGVLTTFVTLVNAIENRRVLELTYYKMFEDETVVRVVQPYDIIPSTTNWRLVARSEELFKQFIIENIKGIRPLDRHFSRSKEYDPQRLFRGSFDYWSGEQQTEVVLRFSRRVGGIVQNTIWSEDQESERASDGSVIIRMKVNSVENVGNWVMAWGKDVKVLKPKALRGYVLRLARGLLRVHK